MFKSLRDKFTSFKHSVGKTVHKKKKAEGIEVSSGTTAEEVTDTQKTPSLSIEKEKTKKKEKKEKVGLKDKAKALIIERETILDEKDLDGPLWELEISLMEGNVALPVAEEIVSNVREELIGEKKRIFSNTEVIVEDVLKDSIKNVIKNDGPLFDEMIIEGDKPVVILFVGVNGTGKTTTIAKVAKRLMDNDYSVVIASGDTYRAGAQEQIETHAERLGLRLIKHQYGADPSAVIYDAVEHAKAKGKDVVLADTAGRMHTDANLMRELQKIKRINSPRLTIFVDEAIAGNDAVERAKQFNEAVGIDGSILSKLDADARGGAAISIPYVTGKPIFFFGVGQRYEDLIVFDEDWLLGKIFGEE